MTFKSGTVLALCLLSVAADQPDPPKAIYGVYGSMRKGRDAIRITPADNGKAKMSLKLYYAYGHTCTLNKEADWQSDHLVITEPGANEHENCKLEASFSQNRILLKDSGQRCARIYCGTRGKLDAVSLRKTGSVSK